MNGRGGCCIARYGGDGGGGGMYDMSKVNRIMLKFRPIAPKPVTAGSGSGSAGSTTENSDGYVKCVRSKRKYVRVNKNKIRKKSKRKVTLSLLPEKPERKQIEPVTGFPDLLTTVQTTKSDLKKSKTTSSPVWLSFNNQEQNFCYSHVGGHVNQVVTKPLRQTPLPQPRKPDVASYVTVECVTDTWVDFEGLGCTDEERVMNMEKDTCPGFISDGQDRVVWTNKAYRQMAGGDDVVVVLVRKDRWTTLLPVTYPAFTCKVRVTTCSAGDSHRQSLTLPCDVWRMDHGGCAWRLDVKAALSLGR